eukprot:5732199-Pleurochrysis_carterae.AAC.1
METAMNSAPRATGGGFGTSCASLDMRTSAVRTSNKMRELATTKRGPSLSISFFSFARGSMYFDTYLPPHAPTIASGKNTFPGAPATNAPPDRSSEPPMALSGATPRSSDTLSRATREERNTAVRP